VVNQQFSCKRLNSPKLVTVLEPFEIKAVSGEASSPSVSPVVSNYSNEEDVNITNDHIRYTVISIRGNYDRPGLLDDLVSLVEKFGLVVVKAKITTVGNSVADTFYCTYPDGRRIEDPQIISELKAALYRDLFSGLSSRPSPQEESVSISGTGAFNLTVSGSSLKGVTVSDDQWEDRSEVIVRCKDRRENILHDVTKVMRYLKLNVHSAEISNVEGQVVDRFYVTYKGKKLVEPYRSAVSNALTAVLVCRDVIADDTVPEDIWT